MYRMETGPACDGDEERGKERANRRQYLSALGSFAAVTIAGCSGGGGGTPTDDEDGDSQDPATETNTTDDTNIVIPIDISVNDGGNVGDGNGSNGGATGNLSDYENAQGDVDTAGLQDAISDFTGGSIDTGLLQDVISAFLE